MPHQTKFHEIRGPSIGHHVRVERRTRPRRMNEQRDERSFRGWDREVGEKPEESFRKEDEFPWGAGGQARVPRV